MSPVRPNLMSNSNFWGARKALFSDCRLGSLRFSGTNKTQVQTTKFSGNSSGFQFTALNWGYISSWDVAGLLYSYWSGPVQVKVVPGFCWYKTVHAPIVFCYWKCTVYTQTKDKRCSKEFPDSFVESGIEVRMPRRIPSPVLLSHFKWQVCKEISLVGWKPPI